MAPETHLSPNGCHSKGEQGSALPLLRRGAAGTLFLSRDSAFSQAAVAGTPRGCRSPSLSQTDLYRSSLRCSLPSIPPAGTAISVSASSCHAGICTPLCCPLHSVRVIRQLLLTEVISRSPFLRRILTAAEDDDSPLQ